MIVPVTLERKSNVDEALRVMRQHNVRALPVIVSPDKKDEFLAMVDVGTRAHQILLSEIVSSLKFNCLADVAAYLANSVKDSTSESVSSTLLDETVMNLINLSHRDPLVPFYIGSPLSALLRVMATGVHRCPLVDDRGRFVSMISQSDVLAFLWTHRAHWQSLSEKPCRSLPRLMTHVKSIHESYLAIDCFRKLRDERVSALAVVQDGALVATLSASDVLRLRKENVALLLRPVSELLHSEEAWPVTLDASQSLKECMSLLLDQNLHRVWLLGEDTGAPVGLCSVTDVLAEVVKLLPPA